MDKEELLEIGTAVHFTVVSEDGRIIEKEGEIQEINEEDFTYDAGNRTYEILVHAEGRVYGSVPADTVREITAASGVEDGEYGFTEEDNELALMNTVESLWYGMDPRGTGDEDEASGGTSGETVFGGRLPAEMERILLNALNEDASGFAVDSDDPPEED